MVKRKFGYLMGVVALLLFTGAKQDNSIVSTEKDLTVINTTELTKDVRGFKGSTPVKIYIKKNRVVRIEALPNQETPRFFDKTKSLLKFWEGKSVTKASQIQPDAVTGATFSSDALIKNVHTGLEYYKKHK